MTSDEEKRVRTLAKILNVEVGDTLKRRSATGMLRRICRVVGDGSGSPEVQSLRTRMRGKKKQGFFRRIF